MKRAERATEERDRGEGKRGEMEGDAFVESGAERMERERGASEERWGGGAFTC